MPGTLFEALPVHACFNIVENSCLPLSSGSGTAPFRDPAAFGVLQRIRDALKVKGYVTTEVRAAMGIEAGFSVKLTSTFDIQVTLGVAVRKNGSVAFDLLTDHFPSWLDRVFPRRSASYNSENRNLWKRLCDAINEVLVLDLNADSVVWLSEKQAKSYWRSDDRLG